MPRAIWKGSISFGLVNAPVAMYAAVSERTLHFHLVHKTDMAPIGYEKTCKRHKKPVPDKEIARAFDLKGKTVLLDDSDFEAARTEGYHAITVLDFVPLDQIDPIYFERTYFLGPADEGAEHVYALLAKALEQSGLAAVCSYIFHQREHLGCLRSRDGVLLLEKLYFADEVRSHKEHRPGGQRIDRRELQMAQDRSTAWPETSISAGTRTATGSSSWASSARRPAGRGSRCRMRPRRKRPQTSWRRCVRRSTGRAVRAARVAARRRPPRSRSCDGGPRRPGSRAARRSAAPSSSGRSQPPDPPSAFP